MPHLMERFKLGPYFDMVMTALDVEHPKPHPESVKRILAGLAVPPEETLYVGDSEVDMKTALAAGVRFVSYKNEVISTGILITDPPRCAQVPFLGYKSDRTTACVILGLNQAVPSLRSALRSFGP